MLTSLGVQPVVFGLPLLVGTTRCMYKYTDVGCTMGNHTEHAFAREHRMLRQWVRSGIVVNGSDRCPPL